VAERLGQISSTVLPANVGKPEILSAAFPSRHDPELRLSPSAEGPAPHADGLHRLVVRTFRKTSILSIPEVAQVSYVTAAMSPSATQC